MVGEWDGGGEWYGWGMRWWGGWDEGVNGMVDGNGMVGE